MTTALLAVALAVRLAGAHSFEPGVLDLREQSPGVFDVTWQAPQLAALAPRLPAHCATVAGGEEAGWRRVDCGPRGLAGERVMVDGIAGTRLDAIVRVAWLDGRIATGVLRGDTAEFVVPGARGGESPFAVFAAYVRLGVEHILLGPDHLLFVAGLVLLVGSWGALVRTVTAFTVAHSLTLALAVLGLVDVPRPPVEAMIALSIVLLAAELARPDGAPPTLARRFPWLVAFTFGLLHGLGFAGALAQVGLPADRLPLALFAFNVGVELGQLAFVAVVAVPLSRLRRAPAPRALRLVAPYAIGTLAMAWTFARVAAFWE